MRITIEHVYLFFDKFISPFSLRLPTARSIFYDRRKNHEKRMRRKIKTVRRWTFIADICRGICGHKGNNTANTEADPVLRDKDRSFSKSEENWYL